MRIIIIGFTFFLLSNCISGQESTCKYWYFEPQLYNNFISDSTHVDYWENYWYTKSGDDDKLMPDSLKIVLDLIPSMSILPKENFIKGFDTKYKLKTTLVFKFGRSDKSYNIICPNYSDTITLLNKSIDLKEIYYKFIDTDEMKFSFYPESIKLKEVLDKLNISIEDESWDYETRGDPYALNQIIISTYFINKFGKIECSSEFTFLVNGAYNNPFSGKWEF